jgi:hypothetical protein
MYTIGSLQKVGNYEYLPNPNRNKFQKTFKFNMENLISYVLLTTLHSAKTYGSLLQIQSRWCKTNHMTKHFFQFITVLFNNHSIFLLEELLT